jgi:hypothetical protein
MSHLYSFEGQYLTDLAKLILHATGDIRASAPGEYVMVKLRRRLDELAVEADGKAAMAVSGRWWRIIEEIRQRTGFCLPRGPIPLDLDGLVENDDADGIPPDRDDTKVANAQTWKSVGVEVDEDC